MEGDNRCVPISGHFIDALIASSKTLENSRDPEARLIAKEIKEIDLTLDEHRVMVAVFGLYGTENRNGTLSIQNAGVTTTAYQLAKSMGFGANKNKIGGKDIQQAIKALVGLSRRSFTVYFKKFSRQDRKHGRFFDVVVHPSCPLISILYESSDVTEAELLRGDFEKKASKIRVRILPVFHTQNYFMLFQINFYNRLKSRLPTHRVSKYHYTFALWLLKQRASKHGQTGMVKINIDKLIPILKVPCDSNHRHQARRMVRKLYHDLMLIQCLQDFKIDQPSASGKSMDIFWV